MNKKFNPELWVAFINGDKDAFHCLYQHFADPLFAFGSKYTRDQDLVKDSIQDLFVDLFKYRGSLSAVVNIKFYLFASLKRKIIKNLQLVKLNEDFDETDLSFHLDHSAEDVLINDEREREVLKKLRKEMSLLPARQQEALYMRFNAELDYEEISELMNVSAPTVRTFVYRAIKQLREKMENKRDVKILLLLLFNKN
jgi:RNA polymerase sigma factor (sigma-70 family)